MTLQATYGDATVEQLDGGVVLVEVHRPPNNHFDVALIRALSDAYEAIDDEPGCRAIVLAAEGKHFSAGANFGPAARSEDSSSPPRGTGEGDLYGEAVRLIEAKTPVVAAVQGAAIGGGLGLACSADFRVGCSETRMAANFAQLGFHHGFGLTVLLPPIVGQQKGLDILMTGRRVKGDEAFAMGLLDRFVEPDEVRAEAIRFAAELASSAPLAVRSIRETMRRGLGESYRAATARERLEQDRLRQTQDFREGIKATAERRPPVFEGR